MQPMNNSKTLKLQLIQQILACDNIEVLETITQLLQVATEQRIPAIPSSDKALHQALLDEPSKTSSSTSLWTDKAVNDLQQSIDEIFGA
jgi:hypothetical protein